MSNLVLSLFSGVGSLDEGFREAGWCVVSAGDVAFSSLYDVRRFHPPAGVFDGVIGGDPCQSHSALANLVRAKGLEPSFPDMTPEFQRVIGEAQPRWFLRENVPKAPDIEASGYDVRSFLLDHSTIDAGNGMGYEQMRRRRFWFGVLDRGITPKRPCPELRAFIDFALFVLPAPAQAATGRHEGALRTAATKDRPEVDYSARYSLDEMLELQGLPKDIFDHSPLTMQGRRKLVGNAVPLPMARALAQAVKKATT